MKRLSLTAQDALCSFSCRANSSTVQIVGAAHAAFYMEGHVEAATLRYQIKKIKDNLAELNAEAKKLDAVLDELEGRKPVVPVDEQTIHPDSNARAWGLYA